MNVDVKRRWAGSEVELRAPSVAFLEALGELMDGDDRVVAMTSDRASRIGVLQLGESHPGRVLNGGSAELSLLAMAAGLASVGKVPVVVTSGTSAALSAGRALKLSIAHTGLHVVVAGLPSGLAGYDGASGHALTDLATVGALPGFRVMAPADAEETAKALIHLVDEPGPGYLRLTDEPRPVLTGPDSPFDFGRAAGLRDGGQLTVIASGALVYEALVATDLLEDEGIEARLLAVHTVQPLDAEAVGAAARDTGALVVAEEHVRWGGVGSRVAQLAGAACPVPIEHLHAGETFRPAAAPAELRAALGLDAAGIVEAARRVLQRKAS